MLGILSHVHIVLLEVLCSRFALVFCSAIHIPQSIVNTVLNLLFLRATC
jgi:hypothetical protein